MSEWEPIETAPKDGTLIRLRGFYRGGYTLSEVTGRYDTGGYTEGWETDRGSHFYPDEWMPLPAPPVDGDGE